MRSIALIAILVATFSANAFAEERGSDDSLCFMAIAASDYRFRGISQTRLESALQGGADYANRPIGIYAGTWLSTIKWIKDMGGNANLEWDVYGGKKGKIAKGVSYDVGVLSYVYPSNDMGSMPGFANADTTEVYGQLGFGPAYVKYSHAITNAFGFADSRNSGYLDIGANLDAGSGFTIHLHAGHQTIRNDSASSYSDWKIGAAKDFPHAVSVSLAAFGTNTGNYMSPAPDMKNLGKSGLVLSVTKMFM